MELIPVQRNVTLSNFMHSVLRVRIYGTPILD